MLGLLSLIGGSVVGIALGNLGKPASRPAGLAVQRKNIQKIHYAKRYHKRTEFVKGLFDEVLLLAESSWSAACYTRNPRCCQSSPEDDLEAHRHALKAHYVPLARIYLKDTSIYPGVESLLAIAGQVGDMAGQALAEPNNCRNPDIDSAIGRLLEEYKIVSSRLMEVDMLLWI